MIVSSWRLECYLHKEHSSASPLDEFSVSAQRGDMCTSHFFMSMVCFSKTQPEREQGVKIGIPAQQAVGDAG
jgi:hypothetical protein